MHPAVPHGAPPASTGTPIPGKTPAGISTASDHPTRPEVPENIQLRPGLEIHDHGPESFILEDAERSKFYKLGSAEACFILSLIESTSIPQARSAAANSRSKTLSDDEVMEVLNWLAFQELLAAPPKPASSLKQVTSWLGSAFYLKLPIGNPDKLLTWITPWCNWLFSPVSLLLGLAVFLTALLFSLDELSELTSLYQGFFSSWRWLWALFAWLVLKLLHELGHALTCRRYGGEVREAGLSLILLMPLAYVNVNSVWRLRSRWQRIHVSLAGVAIELAVAGLALIVWNLTESSSIRTMCADVVVLAVVNSLLFNLNPLMKFDGYFVLVDLTGVDNLYTLGQGCTNHLVQRYLLGLSHPFPELPAAHRWWIPAYGVAAVLYRMSTMVGMIIVASYMFEGLGILLSVVGVVLFLVMPIFATAIQLYKLHLAGQLRPIRLAVRLALVSGILVSTLCIVPSTTDHTLPGIVEYDPPVSLRSSSGGFIRSLPVSAGSLVVEGELIAELENKELELGYRKLESDRGLVEQAIVSAQWESNSRDLATARDRLAALDAQLLEKRAQIDDLVIRSPQAGLLVARNLSQRLGTYLQPGEELGLVGLESHKRIRVSVDQYQSSRAREWVGQPVRVLCGGGGTLIATAVRMDPRVSYAPFDNALLAAYGGSLPSLADVEGKLEFCEPRSEAIVVLDTEQSQRLRVGQRVAVRLKNRYPSMASQLWEQLMGYLSRL